MLEQLSSGQTDPRLLASLAKGRLREKRTELEAALLGRIEPHHRLLIIELLAHVDYLDESIERLSAEIGDRLRPFDEDQRLVDTIPGVNTKTAQVLLAEAGTDISRFPTDRHLSSWAGATTTLRLNFDFEHVHHTFADVIGGGWLTAHQPDGEWLYGADISVRPENRGRGIATTLYAARQDLVWKLGLKGQITAGMIPGYSEVKDKMSAQAYFQGVVSRRIKDPTLSMQMKVGFEPRALLANYINDPVSDNYAVLLVLEASKCVPWRNLSGCWRGMCRALCWPGEPARRRRRPGK